MPGTGKTATAKLWVYAVDDRASGAATPPLAWYRFTANRAGIHPKRELAGFTGFLQAAAYSGFNSLYTNGRIFEVACWAHFRREISNATSSSRQHSPPICWTASASSTPSRPRSAASLPRSDVYQAGAVSAAGYCASRCARRRLAQAVTKIADDQGHSIWHQAMDRVHPLPR